MVKLSRFSRISLERTPGLVPTNKEDCQVEDTLVHIVRGLPHPFDESVVGELADFLKSYWASPEHANQLPLMEKLDHVGHVMIPMPEYDASDFNERELEESIGLLASGDPRIWAQLLHALDDRHSPYWHQLKDLSPYKDVYLMFLDASSSAATLEADLDDALAEEFLRRADAHTFPGNSYTVVVPKEALDLMSFVSAVDDLPSTT